MYEAKANAADYFIYRLTVNDTHTHKVKSVQWVDVGVSADALPSELQNAQSFMAGLVQMVRGEGLSRSGQEAITLATGYLAQAPTFRFDGINGSLNVISAVSLESYPVQYLVNVSFDCLHSGYGDRTSQVLLQVVTHHYALVGVVGGAVVSAILDGQWDELRRAYILK
jgi:hypothetical protein